MDPDTSPSLDHGLPDPVTYLPGTPPWVWALTVVAVLFILSTSYFLFRHFQGKQPASPTLPPKDFYAAALQSLGEIEGECETRPLAEVAAQCSLSLRTYLAGSLSEPALYETVEEFRARQGELPSEAENLLSDLNEAKYSRSKADPTRAQAFIGQSKQCLKTIHSAQNIRS